MQKQTKPLSLAREKLKMGSIKAITAEQKRVYKLYLNGVIDAKALNATQTSLNYMIASAYATQIEARLDAIQKQLDELEADSLDG